MRAMHDAVIGAFGRTFELAPRQVDVDFLGSSGASADLVMGEPNR
jgi:hypothetical protein